MWIFFGMLTANASMLSTEIRGSGMYLDVYKDGPLRNRLCFAPEANDSGQYWGIQPQPDKPG